MAESEERDYYLEGDRVVFTRTYHLRRGVCCGSGCRHCPFHPRGTKGATKHAAPRPEETNGPGDLEAVASGKVESEL